MGVGGGSGEEAEVLHPRVAQGVGGQHATDGVGQDSVGVAVEEAGERDALKAAGVESVVDVSAPCVTLLR
jgi:hypothetical protein